MKINKISNYILVVALFFLLPDKARSQSKIFNGNWTIVNVRSDFGGLDARIAAPIKIKAENSLDSIMVTRNFDGQDSFAEKFKLDGDEVESIIDKTTLRLTQLKWNDLTRGLVFKSTYEVNGAKWVYWRTETWTLKDGFLEVARITIMPDKVDRVKAVYQRQD